MWFEWEKVITSYVFLNKCLGRKVKYHDVPIKMIHVVLRLLMASLLQICNECASERIVQNDQLFEEITKLVGFMHYPADLCCHLLMWTLCNQSDHCSTSFKAYKQNAEKYSISFTSNNTETYNSPFSLDELTNAISKSHDTAVGPDQSTTRCLKIFQILPWILCWVR